MYSYCVYILTSVKRNVMYVGVTNNLENRVEEHRAGKGSAFTRQYRVNTLVYAEEYQQIEEAIAREKEIKGWRRFKEGRARRDVESYLGGPARSGHRQRSLAALGMTIETRM